MSQLSSFDNEENLLSVSDFSQAINELPIENSPANNSSLKGLLSFLNDNDIEDKDDEVKKIQDINETMPIKTITKSNVKDKIKLYSETQRLIRETQTESLKYKPKQFKTFGEFTDNLRAKKQSQTVVAVTSQTLKGNNKENITPAAATQPPKATINNIEYYTQKMATILKKKNNNSAGFFELKSKEELERNRRNAGCLLEKLKKSMATKGATAAPNKAPEFVEIDTVVKAIDVKTGVEFLEPRTVTLKKNLDEKVVNGIDPIMKRQMEAKLSNEELLKWRTMSARDKFVYSQKVLLREAEEKRRIARGQRMKDAPVAVEKEKEEKKRNDKKDGLSDDDFEWTEEEHGEDDESNSGDEEVDEVEEEEDDEEEEEAAVSSRKHRGGMRAMIEEEEEEERGPLANDSDIFNETEAPLPRGRERWERTPELDDDSLGHEGLPADLEALVARLKARFGLARTLPPGEDSSMLLLPTMKTTTRCIEALFRLQLQGPEARVDPALLAQYEQMLADPQPRMVASWTDKIDLLASVPRDAEALSLYSFYNSFSVGHSTLPTGAGDDTLVMPDTEVLPDTEVVARDEDAASDSTVILHRSADTSDDDDNNDDDNGGANAVLANLFKCDDVTPARGASSAREAFASLSSLVHEDDDDEEDIDDVDLDASDSSSSSSSYEDEEDAQRRDVHRPRTANTRVVATEFFEEEAELSGSDQEAYGSDEDEHGLDEYEAEDGDRDTLPSEGRLRREIGRIHQKLELDEDARDVRYLQELYLEDGDLGDGDEARRNRRYTWEDGAGDGDAFLGAVATQDGDSDDEGGYEDVAEGARDAGDDAGRCEDSLRKEEALLHRYDSLLLASRPVAPRAPDAAPRPVARKAGSMLHRTDVVLPTAKAPKRGGTFVPDVGTKRPRADLH